MVEGGAVESPKGVVKRSRVAVVGGEALERQAGAARSGRVSPPMHARQTGEEVPTKVTATGRSRGFPNPSLRDTANNASRRAQLLQWKERQRARLTAARERAGHPTRKRVQWKPAEKLVAVREFELDGSSLPAWQLVRRKVPNDTGVISPNLLSIMSEAADWYSPPLVEVSASVRNSRDRMGSESQDKRKRERAAAQQAPARYPNIEAVPVSPEEPRDVGDDDSAPPRHIPFGDQVPWPAVPGAPTSMPPQQHRPRSDPAPSSWVVSSKSHAASAPPPPAGAAAPPDLSSMLNDTSLLASLSSVLGGGGGGGGGPNPVNNSLAAGLGAIAASQPQPPPYPHQQQQPHRGGPSPPPSATYNPYGVRPFPQGGPPLGPPPGPPPPQRKGPRKTKCKFFGTPTGCQWGNNCDFVHYR